MVERIIIATEQQLNEYAELLFQDIGKALEGRAQVDESLVKALVFKVPSTEEEIFITYPWMKIFTGFQEDIFDIIKQAIGRKLTEEEKRKIELKVYIRKGSNIYELLLRASEFFEGLATTVEASKDMTIGQILALTIPPALAWAFGKAYMVREQAKTERHKADLEAQRLKTDREAEIARKELELKSLEVERRYELERQVAYLENQGKTIRVLESIVDAKAESEAKTAREIQKMPNVQTLEINDKHFTQEDLADIGKRKPRQEKEELTTHIKGDFKTDVIFYPEGKVRKIAISGFLEDGTPYKNDDLTVSKEWLTPEAYELINDGQPLHWDFTITTGEKKTLSVILKEVRPPDRPV